MILEIDDISKFYGSDWVLENISYTITEPEIIGLVAPNGYGKTTLFDIMTNLEKADTGTVRFFGVDHRESQIFKNVSYMQDNRILYETMTMMDHLKFVAKEHGQPVEKIEQVISRLGMAKYGRKKVSQYSLGMKQHLLLAMVLVSETKLILLDEPLNGLDPSSCRLFREIMLELLAEGTTIILSSHNLEEIAKLTDHVLFLHDHDLLSSKRIDEETNELLSSQIDYTYYVSDTKPIVTILADLAIKGEVVTPTKVEVSLDLAQKEQFEAACLAANVQLLDQVEKMSKIDRLYFQLY